MSSVREYFHRFSLVFTDRQFAKTTNKSNVETTGEENGHRKMLAVRIDQVSQLGLYERAQFIVAMFKVLTERFPDETADLSVDALMASIDRGVDLASTYGVILEADIARFLELIVALGDDFDIQPSMRWIGEALRQSDESPAERLDAILERLAWGKDRPWLV
jgi:hypothetical protein